MAEGWLGGIARHDRPRGPIETIGQVRVTCTHGVQGDFRGAVRPGKVPRRQISLMERACWDAAMLDLGLLGGDALPWHVRRINLLVEDIHLPRRAGYVIAIGASLRIEVMGECEPCSRMEEIALGLKTALIPDWRGGVLGRVIGDGDIAIGDEVRIEL